MFLIFSKFSAKITWLSVKSKCNKYSFSEIHNHLFLFSSTHCLSITSINILKRISDKPHTWKNPLLVVNISENFDCILIWYLLVSYINSITLNTFLLHFLFSYINLITLNTFLLHFLISDINLITLNSFLIHF